MVITVIKLITVITINHDEWFKISPPPYLEALSNTFSKMYNTWVYLLNRRMPRQLCEGWQNFQFPCTRVFGFVRARIFLKIFYQLDISLIYFDPENRPLKSNEHREIA